MAALLKKNLLCLVSSLLAFVVSQWPRSHAMSSEVPASQPMGPLESYIVTPANNGYVLSHHEVTPQIQI
jgi:hypothetical protein